MFLFIGYSTFVRTPGYIFAEPGEQWGKSPAFQEKRKKRSDLINKKTEWQVIGYKPETVNEIAHPHRKCQFFPLVKLKL